MTRACLRTVRSAVHPEMALTAVVSGTCLDFQSTADCVTTGAVTATRSCGSLIAAGEAGYCRCQHVGSGDVVHLPVRCGHAETSCVSICGVCTYLLLCLLTFVQVACVVSVHP